MPGKHHCLAAAKACAHNGVLWFPPAACPGAPFAPIAKQGQVPIPTAKSMQLCNGV